ncbi:MAG: hypothetical protein WC474_12700, partial [Hydrogenophilaceae bacterium]
MNKTAIRTLQAQLLAKGSDPGATDGLMCAETRTAIDAALELLDPATKTDWHDWPAGRREVLCLQALCLDAGLQTGDLDGWWGPQTEYACGQLAYLQA